MRTGSQVIQLPWSAWHSDTVLPLTLPSSVRAEALRGTDLPRWSALQIERAIAEPIGSLALHQLAKSCRTACIAVDDLTRPTRAADVLPHVLAELTRAGLPRENCTIVVATGTHGRLTKQQILKKVGADTVDSGVAVEVHDQTNLVATEIRYGKEVLCINKTFLTADLKLGIGCVLPHSFAGFSGGAKMMLPGLADLEATARSHKFVQMGLRDNVDVNNNGFREEIEGLARQLGFHFTIGVVTNSARETAGVFAGDVVLAHRAACQHAAAAYDTPVSGVFDAIILNAFPKDMDLIQSENALIAFKQTGFDVVRESGVIAICTAAKSVGEHGLFAPGGTRYRTPSPLRALGNRELWIFAPELSEASVRTRYWSGYPLFGNLAEMVRELCVRVGQGGRVGVVPTAPMQQLVRPATVAKA